MADIRLAKPAAGATETVPCEPSARFVFDFPTADATLARDGDDLNITFADGSALKLADFYQEYTEDTLPSFSVDGTDVAAADFFEAMNEPDLMPAAGPAASPNPAGARFHEWGDSSLTGGIEHLNGLDWGFSRSFEWEDVPNAVGFNNDDDDRGFLFAGATPATPAPVPATPGVPASPASTAPEEPGDTQYHITHGGTVATTGQGGGYNIVLALDISRSMEQFTADGKRFADIDGFLQIRDEGDKYLYTQPNCSGKENRVTTEDIINGKVAEDLYVEGSSTVYTVEQIKEMIDGSRWNATKLAVKEFLTQYKDHFQGSELSIIAFNGGVQNVEIATDDKILDIDTTMNNIANLKIIGSTNYEAAFLRSRQLFDGFNNLNENKLIFLTDGKPTTHMYTTDIDYEQHSPIKGCLDENFYIKKLRGATFEWDELLSDEKERVSLTDAKTGQIVENYTVGYNIEEGAYYVYKNNEEFCKIYAMHDPDRPGYAKYTSSYTNDTDWNAALECSKYMITNDKIDIIGIGEELADTEIKIYPDGKTGGQHRTGTLAEFGHDLYATTAAAIQAALLECLPATEPEIIRGDTVGINDIIFGDATVTHDSDDDAALTAAIVENPAEFADDSFGNHPDQIIGGLGDDILFGQGGADLLIGDGDSKGDSTLAALGDAIGSDAKEATAETIASKIMEDGTAFENFKKAVDDLETEQDGNDLLFGGSGDDVLLGLGGSDYLNGGAGHDIMFGGSGDDLIVYDKSDYLIDGGDGIDFLLAADSQASLGQLLNEGNGKNGMPIVNDVEVLLKGVDTTSLTSMGKLAEKLGLTLEKGPDGQDRLMVDMSQWDAGAGPDANGVTTWTNTADPGITMETTLLHTSEAEGQAVLTAKVAAETGNN